MPDREMVRRETQALVRETRDRAVLVGGSVAVLWGVEIVNRLILGGLLDGFGIRPRTLFGLLCIPLAPFLHAGFGHLLANTVPLAVLGFLVTARKRMDWWVVAAASTVSAGLGAWLLGGAATIHLGASSVVFGFLGFLMGRGLFERRPGTLVLSVLVTLVFGGALVGMLPFVAAGVSWQAHLFGWLGGLLTSRTLGRALEQRRSR